MTEALSEREDSKDPGDEIVRCRDLVVLCFRAVLHREPEEGDAAAFTNALMAGMPVYDFISELMSTPEFRGPSAPLPDQLASPTPAATPGSLSELMSLSLGLLQSRLTDKGCRIQLGPSPDPHADRSMDAARMERVIRTLAMLDAL